MLVLAASHAGPARNGFLSRVFAVLVVAHNASHQAVVGGVDAVVVVEVDGGERRDVYFELGRGINQVCELWVEGVNALDDEDVVFVQLQHLAVVNALAGLERKLGYLHLFAVEQVNEVLVEQVDVQRLECLKVVVAVFIEGRVFAIHKIVVEREVHRGNARHEQLNGQSLAKGGFAARRRAADEHDFEFVVVVGNFIGNLADFFLVQCFRYLDDGFAFAVVCLIEVTHVGNVEHPVPLGVFAEYVEHLILNDEFGHLLGVVGAGQLQQHAFVVFVKVEHLQVAGGWHQVAVKVVGQRVEPVKGGVHFAAMPQDVRFVGEVLRL